MGINTIRTLSLTHARAHYAYCELTNQPPEESTPTPPMQPRGVSPYPHPCQCNAHRRRPRSLLRNAAAEFTDLGCIECIFPLACEMHRATAYSDRGLPASQPELAPSAINDFRSLEWQFSRRTLAFVRVCSPSSELKYCRQILAERRVWR
jgi:hypothetical protein